MARIRFVPSIQQSIAADFLLGSSFSTLTSKHKITMREIYAILQNHFRSVTIPRTQQSPLAGAHAIGVDDLTSVDLAQVLHDLRDEIRAKDKQTCNYQQFIHEAERSVGELTLIIREKDQDIRGSHEKLSQAEHAILEMMEQQLELNVRREREISEFTIAIEGLEQEIAKQKADIAVLESQLQRPFTASDHRLLKEINIPPDWTVDREALIRIVEGSSFLFQSPFLIAFCPFLLFKTLPGLSRSPLRTLVNFQGRNGN